MSAGNLLGTTRISHPGELGAAPGGRTAKISGGVLSSFPVQNGQNVPGGSTSSRGMMKSPGRLPRSTEMITHRCWIGSCRSSDM